MWILKAIWAFWQNLAKRGGATTALGSLPFPFENLNLSGQQSDEPADRFAQDISLNTRRPRRMDLLKRLSWKWRLIIGLPIACVAVGVPMFAALMVYYTVSFPHPLALRSNERAPVIRILARDGSVLAERGAAHDYMPLDLLPRHVVGAVVAIEDRRFFDHNGIDLWGFARAVFANLRAGRLAQGGSTLTQQLAKNLFLSPERTFSRKLEELALAFWLEMRLSKTEIIELYLNRVYFGAAAYGIEAASQRYFDKSARAMSIGEAALIAGLLKAPSRYSPFSAPELALARGRVVVMKMAETGVITQAQAQVALDEHITFADPQSDSSQNSLEYAVDFVLEKLPPLIDSGHGEVIVETTLDAELQKRAGEVVSNALARQGGKLGASQAALIMLDNDGAIRAMIGGRSYAASQFNRAVKARRQPGSAFKPFVYLAALESGMMPETITYDLPLSINGWAPRNDSGNYAGKITIRQALAQSVNTVAVRINQDVGTARTIAAARRLGITSDLRDDPSIALGTSEVSLLELTGAYAVLSNGGTWIDPHAIRRVRLSTGRVVYARAGESTRQVADPVLVGELSSMLNSAVMKGTGRRAAIPLHPAAGKTGTTQDFRDAWFIGYTAHMTAGVWIGNDDGTPMRNAVGGGLPAQIWHNVMLAAHAGKPPLALPGTARLVAAGSTSSGPNLNTAAPNITERQRSTPIRNVAPVQTSKSTSDTVTDQVKKPVGDGHPRELIGSDFIAKALEGVATSNEASVAEAAPQKQRPATSRPAGMMSLGGWW